MDFGPAAETARIPRPAHPPAHICKPKPSWQFPKSFLNGLNIPFAELSNRGKLLNPVPVCHAVMCGFPRSGTTLCQLMIESCIQNVQCFNKEEMGIQVAKYVRKRQPYIFSKRPKDIFAIEELREYYSNRSTNVRFILFTRDPRSVLTSKHHSDPDNYFVSAENWRAIWEHWQWAVQFPDVLALTYENLVNHPDVVEQQIAEHTGWTVTHPFRDYMQHVPRRFDTRALNGLRPLEKSNVSRWRQPQHHARIQSLLRELPELPERLIELGYERDAAWTKDYSRTAV
ncbi:sulfotransferase domain-containing protein [Planctomicrobium sp. SH664]|uniref:sulfotransferase domain-containing protein n=1 Tax=Planctomicrobium sp. SH664 TaxID=3448125 RepID=UPI003F5BCEAF